MEKRKGTIVVNVEFCKGCGICVEACPSKVLALSPTVNKKGYSYAVMQYPENCVGCASCAQVCPDTVITVYRAPVMRQNAAVVVNHLG